MIDQYFLFLLIQRNIVFSWINLFLLLCYSISNHLLKTISCRNDYKRFIGNISDLVMQLHTNSCKDMYFKYWFINIIVTLGVCSPSK